MAPDWFDPASLPLCDGRQRRDRAEAALLGVAIGDALGMPSQTLTRDQIAHHYGSIRQFVAPYKGHPVSDGLQAGAVTDDTEQSLLLARRLIANPLYFDAEAWANDLLQWEQGIVQRGLHDLLGPSTQGALQALMNGTPVQETGRHGTTNGAAMRIAPQAIATPVNSISSFVNHIEDTCRLTHNTGEAVAAASAVAAVISSGIDGASFEQSLPLALAAADEGMQRGGSHGHRQLRAAIETALEAASDKQLSAAALADLTGTSVASHESIPAAFGIVRLTGACAWSTAVLCANIGDDTDTIGAMATAMAAACTGSAGLPAQARRHVMETNALPFKELTEALLNIREDRRQPGSVELTPEAQRPAGPKRTKQEPT